MYFNNCNTLDQAKTLFRKLCHTMHPDKGGNNKDFIYMYNEFKAFKPSESNSKDRDFNASKFYDVVKKFDGLVDVTINFVGSFIWLEDIVKGATYRQKDIIKAISIDGMNSARFASKKKAWYFSPEDYKRKGRKNYSLNSIKNRYGCESVSKTQLKLS